MAERNFANHTLYHVDNLDFRSTVSRPLELAG